MGMVFKMEMTRPQRLIMLCLADHASDDGNNVRPSVGLVAWKTDYEERTVRRIMDELEDLGLIVPLSRRLGKVTEYRINLEAAAWKSPRVLGQPGRPKNTPDISPQSENTPDISGNTPDIAVSDKPSIEPSNSEVFSSSPQKPLAAKKRRKTGEAKRPSSIAPKQYVEAYMDFFGINGKENPDWPIVSFAGGYSRACKEFAVLRDQGITLELLPFWLLAVLEDRRRRKPFIRTDFLVLSEIAAAINQGSVTKQILAEMAPRTRIDGTVIPSPWTPDYYGADSQYMTKERLLWLRRTGETNPVSWWSANKKIYDRAAAFFDYPSYA